MVNMTPESPRPEVVTSPPVTLNEAITSALAMMEEKGFPMLIPSEREKVSRVILENDLVIVEAETGSGKSTALPLLALAEVEARKPGGRVMVTEPTKFAVDSLYEFLEPKLTDNVGYRHGDGSAHPDAQLQFMVEQSFLNTTLRDGELGKLFLDYDTVIIDEIHARNEITQVLIGLLKKAQKTRADSSNNYPPLKLISTSATMDKKLLKDYFKGASEVSVPGRTNPIDDYWETQDIPPSEVVKKAAEKAAEIHAMGEAVPGDMLIFMPGRAHINATIEELKKQQNLIDDEVEFVILLGGKDGGRNAKKIYEPSSKRRIFVATNVAEASVTPPSVRVVIDSGLMYSEEFDIDIGIKTVNLMKTTQSNTKQRRGRAGRITSGNAYYLFTKEDLTARDVFQSSQILRTDISSIVLTLKKLGEDDVEGFEFLDHPGGYKIRKAISSLKNLGALNEDESISEIGKQMQEMKVDPPLARMLVEARRLGCEEAVAVAIGILQNAQNDIFDKNFNKEVPFQEKYKKFIIPGSDILTRLKVWNEYLKNSGNNQQLTQWAQENGINVNNLSNVANTVEDLLQGSARRQQVDLSDENARKIHRSVALGLINTLVFRKDGRYQTLNGVTGIRIDRHSSVLSGIEPSSFMAGNIRRDGGNIFAGLNFAVSIDEARKMAPYLENILPGEVSRVGDAGSLAEGVNSAVSPDLARKVNEIAEYPWKRAEGHTSALIRPKELIGHADGDDHGKKKGRIRTWLRF